jgi:hypothetical protein
MMATVKENELQRSASQADPGLSAPGPVPEGDVEAFRRGMSRGRGLAEGIRRRLGAWAEEHPGQVVLAGLAAGFVLGKLFLGPRAVEEELD